jgi:hypothetical protein
VHVTAVPDVGVAVRVTVAPLIKDAKVISGVLSDVILSVLEDPKSLAEAKASVAGICVHWANKVLVPSDWYVVNPGAYLVPVPSDFVFHPLNVKLVLVKVPTAASVEFVVALFTVNAAGALPPVFEFPL